MPGLYGLATFSRVFLVSFRIWGNLLSAGILYLGAFACLDKFSVVCPFKLA